MAETVIDRLSVEIVAKMDKLDAQIKGMESKLAGQGAAAGASMGNALTQSVSANGSRFEKLGSDVGGHMARGWSRAFFHMMGPLAMVEVAGMVAGMVANAFDQQTSFWHELGQGIAHLPIVGPMGRGMASSYARSTGQTLAPKDYDEAKVNEEQAKVKEELAKWRQGIIDSGFKLAKTTEEQSKLTIALDNAGTSEGRAEVTRKALYAKQEEALNKLIKQVDSLPATQQTQEAHRELRMAEERLTRAYTAETRRLEQVAKEKSWDEEYKLRDEDQHNANLMWGANDQGLELAGRASGMGAQAALAVKYDKLINDSYSMGGAGGQAYQKQLKANFAMEFAEFGNKQPDFMLYNSRYQSLSGMKAQEMKVMGIDEVSKTIKDILDLITKNIGKLTSRAA